ncbi:unnamed protein product [Ilex paraguariensis]|uniref:Aluminum-activated malate transporter n=1 Tax=Ilex paraguariensis TaxID=185542 RepID=A0ABC8REJ5_9AQUA
MGICREPRESIPKYIPVPWSVRALFREPCEHVAEEVVKVLTELAEAIKNHHHCSPHISDHLHEALEELDTSIKTQPQLLLTSNPIQKIEAGKPMELLGWRSLGPEVVKDINEKITNRTMNKIMITCLDFSETLAIAAFISLLLETVARLDLVIEEVEELGKIAHFKEFHEEEHMEIVVMRDDADAGEIKKDSKDTPKLPISMDTEANLDKNTKGTPKLSISMEMQANK